MSPQIRAEEINPLKIDHVLETCSWSYIAEAVKEPGDYAMVDYEKERQEQ